MKPPDVNPSMYFDFNKENDKEGLKSWKNIKIFLQKPMF